GQWWWAAVIQAGGILTSSYVVLVLVHALAPAGERLTPHAAIPRIREVAALVLALCSLLLGFVPWQDFLSIAPGTSNPLTLKSFATAPWPILGGGVVAILLGRWGLQMNRASVARIFLATAVPARRGALPVGRLIEHLDRVLRQWPAATL